jgi:hypothetical protein
MCTGFYKKGNDVLFGYNLDIDPEVWKYNLVMNKNVFTVAIKIGSTTYYTHGVSANGNFGCLPYMNDNDPFIKLRGYERIDLLVSNFIKDKINYDELIDKLEKRQVSNVKNAALHSLFCNKDGKCVLVEPGCGYKEIKDDYAVISNFPLLKACDDDNPFYGKDRYKIVTDALIKSSKDFSYLDGLKLLKTVRQTGQWGTRLSFVYSKNNNAIYYVIDNDFDHIQYHKF